MPMSVFINLFINIDLDPFFFSFTPVIKQFLQRDADGIIMLSKNSTSGRMSVARRCYVETAKYIVDIVHRLYCSSLYGVAKLWRGSRLKGHSVGARCKKWLQLLWDVTRNSRAIVICRAHDLVM